MTESTIKTTKLDVLCGRDKVSFNHPGNRRFRKFISSHLHQYNAAPTRKKKTKVVVEVVEKIRANGGRFLKYNKQTKEWYEASEKTCREKVGHALRDKTPTNYSPPASPPSAPKSSSLSFCSSSGSSSSLSLPPAAAEVLSQDDRLTVASATASAAAALDNQTETTLTASTTTTTTTTTAKQTLSSSSSCSSLPLLPSVATVPLETAPLHRESHHSASDVLDLAGVGNDEMEDDPTAPEMLEDLFFGDDAGVDNDGNVNVGPLDISDDDDDDDDAGDVGGQPENVSESSIVGDIPQSSSLSAPLNSSDSGVTKSLVNPYPETEDSLLSVLGRIEPDPIHPDNLLFKNSHVSIGAMNMGNNYINNNNNDDTFYGNNNNNNNMTNTLMNPFGMGISCSGGQQQQQQQQQHATAMMTMQQQQQPHPLQQYGWCQQGLSSGDTEMERGWLDFGKNHDLNMVSKDMFSMNDSDNSNNTIHQQQQGPDDRLRMFLDLASAL